VMSEPASVSASMTTKPGPHIAKDASPNQSRRRDFANGGTGDSTIDSTESTGALSSTPMFSKSDICYSLTLFDDDFLHANALGKPHLSLFSVRLNRSACRENPYFN
jgi:hypothetical protein